MDLRQLRALVAVAEHGTFSAAADALDTVQSNVSTHIARLEKEVGSTLIDRSLNRLTPEGEAVVRRARRIASEIDSIGADVAAFRDEVMGDVNVGSIGTAAMWMLGPLLDMLDARYPDTHLRVTEGTTSTLEPAITSAVLNLAITQLPTLSPDITTENLFEEDYLLVVPADHPLAKADEVLLRDLQEFAMILPPSGTASRAEIDQAARRAGASLMAKAEVDGVRLTAYLAQEGHGPAILPATALPSDSPEAWQTVVIKDVPPRRVGLIHHRRTTLSPPVRAVREAIFEVVAKQSTTQRGIRPILGTSRAR